MVRVGQATFASALLAGVAAPRSFRRATNLTWSELPTADFVAVSSG